MPKRYKKPAEESQNQIEDVKDVKPAPVRKAKVKSYKPLFDFTGLKENLEKWKVLQISGLFLILFHYAFYWHLLPIRLHGRPIMF